ncbi:glycosyltransferase family 2 protein [Brevibacterium luteolum]|uniref:glycosyltransferase family 2 protein n=1 Tax=Brevibacterium luteolum TaxID=199591 RepID=UPI00223BDD5A|nr:glycosyltransferase family 2 protein [Brevibacterium luteolum]MCT1874396.1 glycosyltransferase [Brevibacterium luteolum]MCT1891598.1 glycosyltransferase [Brevibacterium luteolum]MCT1894039.1 glycosyltransferase [Brevibacterium luteolum]MCT1924536.1 glycosyltransferase [Brevibacterium luteolum]
MDQPSLSVIIPAKDVEPYIAETLTSLKHQGLRPNEYEVVVVNDGSTDATGEIAARYAQTFEQFRIVTNDAPTGLPAARNAGMRASTGRYIAFIDSDDWFANGHLRVMLDAIERLGVQSVRSDVIHAIGKRRELRQAPVFRRGVPLRTKDHIVHGWGLTMVDFPNAFSGIFARELLDDGTLLFNESLRSAEDREWNWRLFLYTDSFAVVDAPGAYYRREVPTSITAVYNETQLEFIRSCALSIAETRKRPGQEAFSVKALHNLFALADAHLRRRDEMTRQIYHRLIHGVAEAASSASQAELNEVIGSFRRDRMQRLKPVLRQLDRKRESA